MGHPIPWTQPHACPPATLVIESNWIYIVWLLQVLPAMNFDKSVLCPVLIGRENDLQLLDRLLAQSQGASGQIALI